MTQQVDVKTVVDRIYHKGTDRHSAGRNLVRFFTEGLKRDKDGNRRFEPEGVSIANLAIALRIVDPYNPAASLRHAFEQSRAGYAFEAATGIGTNAFQEITGQLIHSKVIEGYEDDEGFVGDRLVEVVPSKLRDQKVTGFVALDGPNEVNENHPYEETGFEEKFVTTKETKKGRLLSLTEELILFDQTGDLLRRARNLGFWTRQERERTIIRAVSEADATNEPVYRPSGTAATLYNTDGSLFNYIGAGNTTSPSFNAAIPLIDWTDFDELRQYRASEVKDDRIDGTSRPIMGLSVPQRNILFVPEALVGTADYIASQMHSSSQPVLAAGAHSTRTGNPARRVVLPENIVSSPFLDEQGGEAVNDWFYGDFRRQFIWTEIWPVQTFAQGASSESAFERDVEMRFKVRYYGGCSAIDTFYVTKIDGN